MANLTVEPAAHWAQQVVGPAWTFLPPPPLGWGLILHLPLALAGLAEQGASWSAWREGRRQEEGNNPILIPQITGWDGRGGGGKPTLFT